ncbi:MAG TPA: hypothetical protein VNO55_19055 [Polyangia bacterium]|nr:hypothetical protein [Polyangia bacterium]
MSSGSAVTTQSAANLQPFAGSRFWIMGGGLAGLLLLAATFAGMTMDPRQTMFSYLVAFAYWTGIGLAGLVLLMIMHAFRAKWVTILRRPIEATTLVLPLMALLFIPIAIGMKDLYIWVAPPADMGHEALTLLAKKQPYLNVTFFVVRTVVYFALCIFLSQRLYGWSTKQDKTGEVNLTQRQRNLGAGGLPFIALVFSFAAFDWLMSLNPLWFSTIFGVYYFAGSFVSVLALLAVISDLARGKDPFGDLLSIEHTHNIGKLMLAFTCFWAYIGFSQLLLIWIANLPEEVPFYMVRFKAEWAWVGVFLIVGHFFLPFGALLSRSLKRDRRRLAAVGVWILLVHYLDLYWLVMPTLHPEGFTLHWTSVTAFVGMGLLAVAFVLWRLRGHFTVPVRDPYLSDSLRYKQP